MARRLNISLDFGSARRLVGQMAWDSTRRVAAVEWDAEFARSPLPFSPHAIPSFVGLHRGRPAPFEGLPGVFADSLPDGWGRLLIDRELTRRGTALHLLTPVDRLAIVGRHGMGALIYEPEEEIAPREEIDLDWFAQTASAIEGDISVKDLQRLRAGTGGSAGARPKFVAQLDAERGLLRDHRLPLADGFSHHIIKYRSAPDSPTAAQEELAYAHMARAAGIDMPEARVLTGDSGAAFFAVERFDRIGAERVHMHTVAGLLETDFQAPTIGYGTLLQVTQALTRHHGDLLEMFRRMAFNVLAHNRDDHAKNHAFLMDGQGGWRVSPAYDLSFSDGPGGEHHLDIAGNGRTPGRDDMLTAGRQVGLKPREMDGILAEVSEAVLNWKTHADRAGVPGARRREIADRIAAVSRLDLSK